MNDQRAIIAMINKSSDYWKNDEARWQEFLSVELVPFMLVVWILYKVHGEVINL